MLVVPYPVVQRQLLQLLVLEQLLRVLGLLQERRQLDRLRDERPAHGAEVAVGLRGDREVVGAQVEDLNEKKDVK